MKKFFPILMLFLAIGVYGQQNPQNLMLLLSGGTFTMGSPVGERGRSANEGPQHQVTLSSFYIGKYPVTQVEYEEIMGRNPSEFRGQNMPVEKVSWFNAVEYCNKRSLKEGLNPVYTIEGYNVTWIPNTNGYRLPTEAEWEYACRAGTDTPFYSGTSVDDAGWYSGNSGTKTHPVGEKEPNAWGLYDMHGNVLEWCWDLLGNYSEEAQTNPQGAPQGGSRVYRGGCWRFDEHQLRSAHRFGNPPGAGTFLQGFRVVRSIE